MCEDVPEVCFNWDTIHSFSYRNEGKLSVSVKCIHNCKVHLAIPNFAVLNIGGNCPFCMLWYCVHKGSVYL